MNVQLVVTARVCGFAFVPKAVSHISMLTKDTAAAQCAEVSDDCDVHFIEFMCGLIWFLLRLSNDYLQKKKKRKKIATNCRIFMVNYFLKDNYDNVAGHC